LHGHVSTLECIIGIAPELVLARSAHGTIAHIAAAEGYTEVLHTIRRLLGPELLQSLHDGGRTIAHFAAARGHTHVLVFIEACLGDSLLFQADDEGRTIAHDAARHGHTAVLQHLRSR
jgi:hypothetical protein